MDSFKNILFRLPALILLSAIVTSCGEDLPTGNLGNPDAPPVNDGVVNLNFQGASTTQLQLKGQGGNDTSIVSFKTTNSNGDPVSGISLSFELDTSVGGVTLLGDALGRRTNSLGIAAITLSSGTVATPVRVSATIDGTETTAVSNDITISTGVPVADKFFISAGPDWYPEDANNLNGVSVPITIQASDQFGNPAFDGIRVSFWSPESGTIQPSCTLAGGSCTVNWTSGSNGSGSVRWASIFAFTQGAEPFIDEDGDSMYDSGEIFEDLPEPYVDENENDIFDIGEAFVDFNEDGSLTSGNGVYDGPCIEQGCIPSSVVISTQASLYLCDEDPTNNEEGSDCETEEE